MDPVLGGPAFEPTGRIVDDRQRVVDLMGRSGRQRTQGRKPVGGDELLLHSDPEAGFPGLLLGPDELVKGLPDLADQVLDLDRFGQVIEGAGLDTGHAFLGAHISGDQDDLGVRMLLPDMIQDRQAVHARHPDVQEDHVDRFLRQGGQRLLSAGRLIDHGAPLFQPPGQGFPKAAFVIDDQDPWFFVLRAT